MATAKGTNITTTAPRPHPRRDIRVAHTVILTLLVIPGLLTAGGMASARCGADFLFPTKETEFYELDSIVVTYRSSFSNPSLSCLCGAPGRATQKFRTDNAVPYNGSALVLLNFSSSDPCWFHLSLNTGACGDISKPFIVLPTQRRDAQTIIGVLTPRADVPKAASTASPSPLPQSIVAASSGNPTVVAVASQDPKGGGDNLSPGAKAAIGIGIALGSIALGVMAAFLYFRRRKRGQDTSLTEAIIDHGRRKGPEKPVTRTRNGGASLGSGRSDEALYPIQPVFDGFPGSMGYDDVRSLHSNANSHSPTGQHSPASSNNGGFWASERPDNSYRYDRSTEREELSAARLNSQPIISVVTSYGPNPVTPTLTPRVTLRPEMNKRAVSVSIDSLERVPPLAALPSAADYSNYRIPPPAPSPVPLHISEPSPSPPRKHSAPVIISYGPNRVTPTPAVTSPTVPPDEGIYNRRIVEQGPHPITSHERQFSWEAEADELMMNATMVPLPPYASSKDFDAMEKGAIRKLAEPQAEAELPPTKDGFYHDGSEIVEYELPGAAPQHEPQLPFRPYRTAGPSGGSYGSGYSGGGGGRREIDEQKFLLSDIEISRMRAQKMKVRAAAAAQESYDLGERMPR
ncbi:hypothetical protein B0T26DRAFT_646364 [Lasiosphaeria miniovina]|uniref:Uncharacterized protein n=1 Tax=Lasiosphaeria miniovina TaxID=1954250 RepID=A0AA40E0Q7_9PEZI|nr:uncharacterized protein B0T26DRAFT_646364 [Lasiosphaeria miniovina]KAK0718413.1 hypothetical protein B0T26DRAFT_646364 [Lasiosphaeria miniovina]